MALIKCSECGREISDKATACVHCGCPVSASLPAPSLSMNFHAVLSGPDSEKSPQSVYVPELGRNVEFPVDNDSQVGESYKITLREGSKYDHIIFTVASISKNPHATPASSPVNTQASSDAIALIKRYKPNLLVKFFKSGFLGKFIGMTITFLVVGRFSEADAEVIVPLVGICFVILLLGSLYPMANVKGYLRRHHIDQAIRQDSGYMNVAICAFNLLPSKKMLSYIRDLNPAAARKIESQLAEKEKK